MNGTYAGGTQGQCAELRFLAAPGIDTHAGASGLRVNFPDAITSLTRKSVHLWTLRHRFGGAPTLLSSDSTP
jgi:hypothetical protein